MPLTLADFALSLLLEQVDKGIDAYGKPYKYSAPDTRVQSVLGRQFRQSAKEFIEFRDNPNNRVLGLPIRDRKTGSLKRKKDGTLYKRRMSKQYNLPTFAYKDMIGGAKHKLIADDLRKRGYSASRIDKILATPIRALPKEVFLDKARLQKISRQSFIKVMTDQNGYYWKQYKETQSVTFRNYRTMKRILFGKPNWLRMSGQMLKDLYVNADTASALSGATIGMKTSRSYKIAFALLNGVGKKRNRFAFMGLTKANQQRLAQYAVKIQASPTELNNLLRKLGV